MGCIAVESSGIVQLMGMAEDIIMVFVTASSQEEAARISDEALKAHEAACATTLPTAYSTYWWEGKLVNAQECLVMLKTTADRFEALQKTILKAHSYKVPEIVAVQVNNGLPPYLEWIRNETSQ